MRDAFGTAQSLLVLGGGSEIGAATARRLIADRCRTVILAGRPADNMDPVAESLREAGATTVETVMFDSLDTSSHPKVIDDIFDRHGDIDVVMLAFGLLGDQARFDEDPAAAAETVAVNYTGAVSAGLAVARRLRQQGHGTFVVMSSVAGERARKSNYVYGSSKAGLDAFAQGLADSLAGSGAGVLVVRPGFVKTQMTAGLEPPAFSTTPERVADAIADGVAKGRDIVWVPPPLRWIFATFRHLPRPLWRKVSAGL
jgi:decaprenylphospho-beta-D-erythro-pentofuranosid-2-ulose 2-reductase